MLVPERQASGVKLKTLEAANHGLPIVTTSCGREGTMLIDGVHCRVADDEATFAAAAAELLGDGLQRDRLAGAARERVRHCFSPDSVFERIDGVLARLCEEQPVLCSGTLQS